MPVHKGLIGQHQINFIGAIGQHGLGLSHNRLDVAPPMRKIDDSGHLHAGARQQGFGLFDKGRI